MLQVLLGVTLLVAGIALSFLPGPGLPLLVGGLAVLAPRWPLARRVLDWLRARIPARLGAAA